MRLRWRLWVPGLATFVATFAVFAIPPAAGQSEVPLDVQDVDVGSRPGVALTVTAPRELVGVDLGQEHFSLFENGTERDVRVRRVSSDTLEVVLVIDTSGSMEGEPMAAAKGAAIDFISAMPRGTRVGVVGFGTEPTVARPLSTDTDALIAAVQGLEATGETALYDAVITVTEELAAEANPDARRVVIVLSDGGDTASVRTLDEAVGLIGGVETGFYAVALATAESDLGALGRMATATGGRVVAASDPSEIAAVYDDIASQLVNQYRLSYRSDTEGTATIQVTLAAEGITATGAEQVDLGFIDDAESPRAAAPSAPSAYTAPGPGLLAGGWTLLAGVIPMALALFVAGWLVTSQREPKRRRLARELGSALGGEARSALAGMTDRATAFADRMLSQNEERTGRLNAKLEQAGLAVRPGEFIVFAIAVVAGGTAVGLVMLGPAMAAAAVVVLSLGVWQGLNHMQRRRQRALADQLGDTLQLLAGSLRAGHGLIQALDQVTREAESPTAEEFHRVIVEARLGRDLSDALSAMAKRAGNEDVEWVVQAIRIHREVGGDLSEILDRVGETIRDRNRVRGQIRSLTAEGRLSGLILMALPFLVGGWMYMTNRPYIMELFTRPAGRVILAVGAVLMTMGAAVMKRLVKPEF